jgi:ATP-binding cassette subfamily B protein
LRRAPSGPPALPASGDRHDWQTIKKLIPYLWAYKWRVLFALGCLISAKFANVTVPLIFKQLER